MKLYAKYDDEWYRFHIDDYNLVDRKIIYSYEKIIAYYFIIDKQAN